MNYGLSKLLVVLVRWPLVRIHYIASAILAHHGALDERGAGRAHVRLRVYAVDHLHLRLRHLSLRYSLTLHHGSLTTRFILGLRNHAELADKVECLLHVQIQWLECWVNTYLVLLEALAFGDALQCLDGSTDELRYVVDSGEDLGIGILFYKFE